MTETKTFVEAGAHGQLSVSGKFAVEICSFIRGRPVDVVRKDLGDVIALKRPVPFKRFTWDLGHRKGGVGPGRYPVKAAEAILGLVNSAAHNASSLNMDCSNLIVSSAYSVQAPARWRAGRQRRRRMKRTHVYVRLTPGQKPAAKKGGSKKK